MHNARLAAIFGAILTAGFIASQPVSAQEISPHARAKAEVETRDAKHHNKAKTELIPTAGGAVAGGVVGGPPGAFLGAKTGHTVGSVFHGVKKHRDVKKQEEADARRRHLRRVHALRHRTVTSTSGE